MNVTSVDPDRLCISDLNEREGFDDPDAEDSHIEIDDLVESVAEIGVVQPPLVRPANSEHNDYSVVIGQRRTLAAQAVKQSGRAALDELPVIVVDWDDGESLAASIVENIDAFSEKVGKADRARAIDRLKDLHEWSDQEVAEHLGVAKTTVSNWLEPLHPHWRQVEQASTEDAGEQDVTETGETGDVATFSENGQEDGDGPSIDVLQNVRRGTEPPEESAEVLRTVEDEALSKDDVREARQRSAETDESMEQTVADVASEKRTHQQTPVADREQVCLTVTGEIADALREAATDAGVTTKQYAQAAIRQRLGEEGWLSDE